MPVMEAVKLAPAPVGPSRASRRARVEVARTGSSSNGSRVLDPGLAAFVGDRPSRSGRRSSSVPCGSA